MLFGSDRNALRRTFTEAWRRRVLGLVLEPLQARIAQVVEAHPEYHAAVQDPESLDRDYVPENGQTNPFLHMAMHLALVEQRATDRPSGIARALELVDLKLRDPHAAEHAAMECLGRVMWEAQRVGTAPDERIYLECVRQLGRRRRWDGA